MGKTDTFDNIIKLEFLSLSQNESFARAAAAAFIMPLDPTIEELADVRTAVSEAVTNAIIHGYKKRAGIVSMELKLISRRLIVRVEDKGCGIGNIELAMQPFYTTGNKAERSGMGFAVMGAFMDRLEVESEVGKGTVVMMEKLLCAENSKDGLTDDPEGDLAEKCAEIGAKMAENE